MITTKQLRSEFLNYFKKQGHKILSSSPLIPQNDPSLIFTNAGMVQFKDYFTGTVKAKYKTVATSQKCVRAGGKHNDLDNVGYTARHHTFFEMLGNFSFGDYFKEDAIKYSWEFLTKILQLPQEKLLVTIYHTDEEAYQIWKEVSNLPDNKIIRIETNDNFWSMGDIGPCGPCSEIFYDHGEDVPGGPPGSKNEDGDRFIEIWNLVFMQYEQMEDGTRKPLPKPCIDTGTGLERLVAVLQGVHNNYEIDLFQKLINNSKSIIGDGDIFSHRVITDHLRSSSFLIADGVLPSNEGRGYVLRRIMRRAMRHIHQLGARNSCMYKLVPSLIDEMGEAYPELKRAESLIIETLKAEEDRFRTTLDKGLKLLEEEVKKLGSKKTLSGKTAFKLYDTYGFPLDLTEDILKQKNISVDQKTFDIKMTKQKQLAKAAWKGSGDSTTSKIYIELKDKLGETEFVGYTQNAEQTEILGLILNGKSVKSAKKGDSIELITQKTPFYGESGGQVGDSGLIIKASKNGTLPLPFSIMEINDTKKPVKNFIIHKGIVEEGEFKVGDLINMSIDSDRRAKIKANHSAAHLLQYALRQVIGDSITQKGSYVDEYRLRFDVSCQKPINNTEIIQIEEIVNKLVIKNSEVKTEVMELLKAQEKGVIALFGEKYDDQVRVVSMGSDNSKIKHTQTENKQEFNIADLTQALQSCITKQQKDGCSMELCGGTHVSRTGDIGLFKIIDESSIAAGIRRIEAVTGLEAFKYVNNEITTLNKTQELLKVSKNQISEKIENILEENKKLKKELQNNKTNDIAFDKPEEINNIKFYFKTFKDASPKDIKSTIINLQNNKPEFKESSIVLAIVQNEEKVSVVCGVSQDLTKKYNAVELTKLAVKELEGQGAGGQPTLAMGGGSNFSKAQNAVDSIKNLL